ncbi:MAG: hypothetical protein KatS3mg087_1337 [Patescibacteria group bacterium]|nr:MAG: hypothetical protein KatS3mg087_1337 [Patescibacteria group bacterium]
MTDEAAIVQTPILQYEYLGRVFKSGPFWKFEDWFGREYYRHFSKINNPAVDLNMYGSAFFRTEMDQLVMVRKNQQEYFFLKRPSVLSSVFPINLTYLARVIRIHTATDNFWEVQAYNGGRMTYDYKTNLNNQQNVVRAVCIYLGVDPDSLILSAIVEEKEYLVFKFENTREAGRRKDDE